MPKAEAAGDLNGRGVLVTRPAHQAEALCGLIEAAGGRAIRFPLLAIEPLAVETPNWKDYALAIFVSRNAVEQAPQPPAGLPLAVVGKGSAEALRRRWGREPLSPEAGFDSEALLALPALRDVAGRRILILRGEGGRELLADTLRERGAEVEYLELYRRTMPPLQAIGAEGLDYLLITSGQALEHLAALYGGRIAPELLALPLLVVSERLAGLARAQGFKAVRVAPEPGDAGLLAGLKDWARERVEERA